jgi:hypothetical protein
MKLKGLSGEWKQPKDFKARRVCTSAAAAQIHANGRLEEIKKQMHSGVLATRKSEVVVAHSLIPYFKNSQILSQLAAYLRSPQLSMSMTYESIVAEPFR